MIGQSDMDHESTKSRRNRILYIPQTRGQSIEYIWAGPDTDGYTLLIQDSLSPYRLGLEWCAPHQFVEV